MNDRTALTEAHVCLDDALDDFEHVDEHTAATRIAQVLTTIAKLLVRAHVGSTESE